MSGNANSITLADDRADVCNGFDAVLVPERDVTTAVEASGGPEEDSIRAARRRYEKLTDREREVVQFVGQGYSAPEIGRRLSISPKTVDTYKRRIQEKAGLSHRSEYVQFALKLGLLVDSAAPASAWP